LVSPLRAVTHSREAGHIAGSWDNARLMRALGEIHYLSVLVVVRY